jgi:hypothetical protein
MLEERVEELEKKAWQGNQTQLSLDKKGCQADEEGVGQEGGCLEGGLTHEEGGHQGHGGLIGAKGAIRMSGFGGSSAPRPLARSLK